MTVNQIMQAMEERLKQRFPDDPVYWDRIPKDFKRPCFTLECVKQQIEDVNIALVQRTEELLITCYEQLDAYRNSSREKLNERQDAVMALFGSSLRVEDRSLTPTVMPGEGTPDLVEVTVIFSFLDDRTIFRPEVGENDAPSMEKFTWEIGTTKGKE